MEPAEPRRAYYGKWDAFAAEQAAALKGEAAAETASAERALGLGDAAKAAATASKREALRAAKAQWAATQDREAQAKHFIEDRTGGAVSLDAAALGDKQVVHVRACVDCVFTLPADAVLAKLFIEACTRCTFLLHGRLITGHAEVWSCADCELLAAAPLPTLQVDLCSALRVRYASRACLGALVHAGARGLALAVAACDAYPEALEAALGGSDEATAPSYDETQFITRLVGGSLLTERVIRDATDYPTTARELREAAAAEAGAEGGSAGDDALGAASEDELAAALAARRCAVQREAGNAAFRSGDFASAAVAYTAALAAAPGDAAARSNRAAAFLKLGRHAQALEDATSAALATPDAAKAHFRKGLALHALARYAEAGPALARAQQLEPRNAQIADAMRMTEVAIARLQRQEAER